MSWFWQYMHRTNSAACISTSSTITGKIPCWIRKYSTALRPSVTGALSLIHDGHHGVFLKFSTNASR